MAARGNCGGNGARFGFWRASAATGAGSSAVSSFALVQPACRQPDTNTVVHKYFHSVGPPIGEDISAVRLRSTEYCAYSSQGGLGAGAHIHALGGEPDGVDASQLSETTDKTGAPVGIGQRPAATSR